MKPAAKTPRATPVKKETTDAPAPRKPAEPPKPIVVNETMAYSLITQRYEAGGWHLSPRPRGLICDFIAVHGTRCHLIKLVGADSLENNPQVTPNLAENDFVRAATSIGATPVHVSVTARAKRTGDLDYSTTFRQAGTNSPVIIGK